ncbi:hypothetical protein [Streptomyces sp. NPDC026673]|uniref:hypothetical protein n=1 Tax=Streptomyces sp. NPDC026673 TaxID=3155724 RepID=UPI00340088A0
MTRLTSTSTAGRGLSGAAVGGSRACRGATTAAAGARAGRIVRGAAVRHSIAGPCTGPYATAAGRSGRRHDFPQEKTP